MAFSAADLVAFLLLVGGPIVPGKQDGGALQAALEHGESLLSAGDIKGAIDTLKNVEGLAPNDARPAYLLSVALRKTGDIYNALAEARRAVRLDPKNAVALTNLGRLLSDKQYIDDARDALRRAARLDPRDARPWIELSRVELWQGNPKSAAEAQAKAAQLASEDHGIAAGYCASRIAEEREIAAKIREADKAREADKTREANKTREVPKEGSNSIVKEPHKAAERTILQLVRLHWVSPEVSPLFRAVKFLVVLIFALLLCSLLICLGVLLARRLLSCLPAWARPWGTRVAVGLVSLGLVSYGYGRWCHAPPANLQASAPTNLQASAPTLDSELSLASGFCGAFVRP